MIYCRALSAIAASALLLLPLAGCHVSSHKNGENDNVDIGTPFGSLQVKTDDNANGAAIGITPYPGAVPVKDGDGKHSADVNMNFGSFHLGVKTTALQTTDDEGKVLAFYRHDLARYGDVIECNANATVGVPKRTAEGLTCSENSGAHHGDVNIGSGLELRTGSPHRQHIVALQNRDGGTRIGLVALDLPDHFGSHDRGASE